MKKLEDLIDSLSEKTQQAAETNNFRCKRIKEGKHYDYLAELQPLKQ